MHNRKYAGSMSLVNYRRQFYLAQISSALSVKNFQMMMELDVLNIDQLPFVFWSFST